MTKLLFLLTLMCLNLHAMVIGHDSRSIVSTPSFPFTAVGMLEAFDGQVCTGALVAEDIVLSAAHCIEREGRRLRAREVRFHTAYHYGTSTGEVIEVEGFFVGARPLQSQDWMLVKLKKKIGRRLGFLATGSVSEMDLHTPRYFIPGFDVGFSRNVGTSMSLNQVAGRVKNLANDLMYHDIPTGIGSSGGPLLENREGKWTVVGITVAQARNGTCRVYNMRDCHNIAVPESAWRATLEAIR
jgi:protease YdgD